jgi:phenylalanyl-tRNA synthetase beta chain
LRRILGIDVAPEEVRGVLENLGLTIVSESEDDWAVLPPTFRSDLLAEEDLVEEVARIYGYDRIPERAQVHASAQPVRESRVEDLWRSRRILLSLGLTEGPCDELRSVDPGYRDFRAGSQFRGIGRERRRREAALGPAPGRHGNSFSARQRH